MANSLLAFLYPRIKGSQEDVATYSLNYILGKSEVLRSEFTRLISQRLHLDYQPLIYSAQVIGSQKERPDIVGVKDEQEEIIIEAKFFAALTENQPGTYLDRLQGRGGLIFICPESRLNGLWAHLQELEKTSEPLGEYCVNRNGTHMAIISWKTVFEALQLCSENNAIDTKEDLHQLIGFCKEIESNDFIPFKAEDLGADMAKSMDRYYILVDAVIDQLLIRKDIIAHTKRLRATPQWMGYTRYINVDGIGLGLYFHRGIWKKSTPPSPFCLGFFTDEALVKNYLCSLESRMVERDNNGFSYIVLTPPIALTREESAQYLADQIVYHVRKINEKRGKQEL